MTTLREAAQQALDALEESEKDGHYLPVGVIEPLREALAQPEPEPVAIVVAAEYEDGSHAGHRLEWRGRNEANDYPEGTEFYTQPPQREWIGLTDAELEEFSNMQLGSYDLCDAVEERLEEKNRGEE